MNNKYAAIIYPITHSLHHTQSFKHMQNYYTLLDAICYLLVISCIINLLIIFYFAFAIITVVSCTRCSAIAERPRCRVRYSFRQK